MNVITDMAKYFTIPLSNKETNIYVKYLFSLDSTLDGKKIVRSYKIFYNPISKQRDKLKLLSLEIKLNFVEKEKT